MQEQIAPSDGVTKKPVLVPHRVPEALAEKNPGTHHLIDTCRSTEAIFSPPAIKRDRKMLDKP